MTYGAQKPAPGWVEFTTAAMALVFMLGVIGGGIWLLKTVFHHHDDAAAVSPIADTADANEDAVKALVRAAVRDPGSVEFSDVTVHGAYVCGRVNANNAAGGKTGFQRFVGNNPSLFLEEDMKPSQMDQVWNGACR